jgi:hypothetical protein
MQLPDGPVYFNALSQVDMQSSKCPIHQIPTSTLQKFKSLQRTTAPSEPQWVQLRSADQFALVLDTVKFVALLAFRAGSLFPVD